MRIRGLLPALLLVACSRETATTTTAPVAPPPAPATTTTTTAPAAAAPKPKMEKGAFVVIHDGKPMYREQFVRNARRIESDIAAWGNHERVQQITIVNPDATVAGTAMKIIGANFTIEQMGIAIRGTRADVELVDKAGRSGTKTIAVPPGTIPNPVPESLAILEQVIRRARVIGRKNVEIAMLPGTLRLQRVVVTFTGPDTAEVRTADSTLDVKIDADGRLLSGREAAQKIEIRRE
jgi:hypothetical protein